MRVLIRMVFIHQRYSPSKLTKVDALIAKRNFAEELRRGSTGCALANSKRASEFRSFTSVRIYIYTLKNASYVRLSHLFLLLDGPHEFIVEQLGLGEVLLLLFGHLHNVVIVVTRDEHLKFAFHDATGAKCRPHRSQSKHNKRSTLNRWQPWVTGALFSRHSIVSVVSHELHFFTFFFVLETN